MDNGGQFPTPANGRPTAGDVWGLLAHPVWGMGALHQKVENLNDHVNRIEGETNKRLDSVDEAIAGNKETIGGVTQRLIARDAVEAEFGRERLAQAERKTVEKEEHRKHFHTQMWEKGFYVVSVGVGGMALALSTKVDSVIGHAWNVFRHL